ncbi:MAG: heme d1 biosynthesis radical SAM protein NirJ [Alphaproteobacteria bacterium]|nr:heme d1 biosynthesis radical SAM protein NirJ [Alphaproteobacteria bacterium]
MFRLSHYMHQLIEPTPVRRRKGPVRPVVIWNLTRRCNLKCRHCYAVAADRHFPGELTTSEAIVVLDDLAAFGIPALILSGGEPLSRPDTLDLARRSKAHGLYTALSTNGTTINEHIADEIAEIGFDYVGISLDGIGATNDWFRGATGAFDEALAGVRACRARGIKVGLRFTMTKDNAGELPDLLALAADEGVEKFYLSHLVYAGRGNKHRADDTQWQVTRKAVELLIERAWRSASNGEAFEIVTGNNDADAVTFLRWAQSRFTAEAIAQLRQHLEAWGGNSSGLGVANIDTQGVVHPDTYWSDYSIDSVRNRPFSEIWHDLGDPMLAALRLRPRPLKGRCGACAYKSVCGGNTRIRALQLTGDPWEADPACYLGDAEIGLAAGNSSEADRLQMKPFRGRSHDPAHRFA